MNVPSANINEQQAAAAFTKQSSVFDALYSHNAIIQYKRQRVRDHMQQYLSPASNILELNSGTGEDAIWLARQGHRVHATDISEGMQQMLANKIKAAGAEAGLTYELCSFTALQTLQQKGPYDHIFSNFAGLNCTGELKKVLQSFSSLLKPGGTITLVVLPTFCLWEFLVAFKGKIKTAVRRLISRNGANAHIEGVAFKCWYYNPSYIIRHLKNEFDLLSVEGLCTIVPPSYMENFAEKHPKVYRYLQSKENKLKNKWPWKYIGDYYIISFQKKR